MEFFMPLGEYCTGILLNFSCSVYYAHSITILLITFRMLFLQHEEYSKVEIHKIVALT
jgi:hypothetical protein